MPSIVLMRPAEPMNIGAVARAMRNCELDDLILVAPLTDDWVTARRVAVHAEDLISSLRIVSSLAEAVADRAWVVGTTSRGLPGRTAQSPRSVAEEGTSLGARWALVFGGEESGLSNDDLVHCHAVSTIPSGTVQPSFNLAQAVLVYGYEVHQRALTSPLPVPKKKEEALASESEAVRIEEVFRQILVECGFADPDRPRHGVVDLVQPLRRARLTGAEAGLWHATLRTILAKTRRYPGR
jgi:tRNA/rRNA methyltransferase